MTLHPCLTERNHRAEPRSGTPLISLAKKDIAEPAEPFPTQHAGIAKYMIRNVYSFICRFRRFRRNTFLQNVWEKVPQVPLCTPSAVGKGGVSCA